MSSDNASQHFLRICGETQRPNSVILQGAKSAQKRERNQKNAAGAAKSQLKTVRVSGGLERGKRAQELTRPSPTERQGYEHSV